MAVILWLASDGGSAENTGRWIGPILRFFFPTASPFQIDAMHAIVRKLGHVTEYAILVGLWFRAFLDRWPERRRQAAWLAWAIAAGWAAIDESVQATTGSRTGSPLDVLIDLAGASVVAVPAGHGVGRLADVLLWIAAVGGAGLIGLNVVSGVPSGFLWLTVPVAIAALVVVRRRRTSAPPRP
jgi:VanZ family protein